MIEPEYRARWSRQKWIMVFFCKRAIANWGTVICYKRIAIKVAHFSIRSYCVQPVSLTARKRWNRMYFLRNLLFFIILYQLIRDLPWFLANLRVCCCAFAFWAYSGSIEKGQPLNNFVQNITFNLIYFAFGQYAAPLICYGINELPSFTDAYWPLLLLSKQCMSHRDNILFHK